MSFTAVDYDGARAGEIYQDHYTKLAAQIDKMFGALLVSQYALGVVFACFISPFTWVGGESQLHIHVRAALFLGAAIVTLPLYLIWKRPGATLNRYVIAVAQMLFSILFIHLTGGRIETHFHVFGSLAFIAFYRDWKTLVVATVVTALDHLLRGIFWPYSVYGVLSATPWRALEHAGWVLFEDFFLFFSIRNGLKELLLISVKQAGLEKALANVENEVLRRTKELRESQATVVSQQQTMVSVAKMSALGEMAGGVAHEINNPLAIIYGLAIQLKGMLQKGNPSPELAVKAAEKIELTVGRAAKIVKGLLAFSRDGTHDPFQTVELKTTVEDALELCRQKLKNDDVTLEVQPIPADLMLECRPSQISQVLLNLIQNAHDAVASSANKRIKIEFADQGSNVEIGVVDSGPGVPADIQDRIMDPFFTTKDVGKGTGLGLSISARIARDHRGQLFLDKQSQLTRFAFRLPKAVLREMRAAA